MIYRLAYALLICLFFYALLLIMPVRASVELTSIDKRDAVLFKSAGAFKNPEFVERDIGWEISGCALGASYSTVVPFAARTLTVTCVLETLTIRQCTDNFKDLKDAYLDAYSNVKVNATSTDVYWRITDGTNVIQSYTLKQDDEWHPISSAPFFASDTGNCIEIVSEPNFTGDVSVTQANIKQNFQFAQVGHVQQTQSTLLTNVGNVTTSTDLSELTKDVAHSKGAGIYTLSSDGVTFLQEANVDVSHMNGHTSGAVLTSIIYLNGSVVGGEAAFSNTKGVTSSFSGRVNKGDKITFSGSAGNTNRKISIKATISSPVLAEINYRKPVTKYLQSNITSNTADITSLKFTDLKIGQHYEVNMNLLFGYVGSEAGNRELTAKSGGDIVCVVSYYRSATITPLTTQLSSAPCVFTAKDDELIFSATLPSDTFYGNGTVSQTWVSLVQVENTMLAHLNQSNIIQDVEQFPLTEQKLCDACYKGKALYKKCLTGSVSGQTTIATGVVELYKSYGWVERTSGSVFEGKIHYPAILNSEIEQIPVVRPNGNLINYRRGSNWGSTAEYCIEYTKD